MQFMPEKCYRDLSTAIPPRNLSRPSPPPEAPLPELFAPGDFGSGGMEKGRIREAERQLLQLFELRFLRMVPFVAPETAQTPTRNDAGPGG